MKKSLLFLTLFFSMLSLHAATVVGIHGLFVSYRTMAPIEHALDRCFNVVLFEFESRQESICSAAQKLNVVLRQLACECPGEPIYFVTHSIGGVILKTALNLPDAPQEAKMGRAVLLAPPLKGSCLARSYANNYLVRWAMGPKCGSELMMYSPQQMECLGQFPSTMEVLVLAGCQGIKPFFEGRPNDTFLAVEETCLNTYHYHKTLPLKHGGLINSPASLLLTRQFLLFGPQGL